MTEPRTAASHRAHARELLAADAALQTATSLLLAPHRAQDVLLDDLRDAMDDASHLDRAVGLLEEKGRIRLWGDEYATYVKVLSPELRLAGKVDATPDEAYRQMVPDVKIGDHLVMRAVDKLYHGPCSVRVTLWVQGEGDVEQDAGVLDTEHGFCGGSEYTPSEPSYVKVGEWDLLRHLDELHDREVALVIEYADG